MSSAQKVSRLIAAICFASFAPVAWAQHYIQKNLVSDIPQPNNADGSKVLIDPNLKNPWGLTRSSGSPWWVGNNNSGTSTLYDGSGNPINIFPDPAGSMFDNFVIVPPPKLAPPGTQATPTGVVFNGNPNDFLLDKGTPTGKPALFIFATEDGTISGWNPVVNLRQGANPPSIDAVLEVDNSDQNSGQGAVYKGATTAQLNGRTFLYVTNFRSGKIEVYDSHFARVHLPGDAFNPNADGDHDQDDGGGEHIPRGFAPFNIQNIGGSLFVTYAKQNAERHDDVAGDGNGFVEIFTPAGKHIGHLEHGFFLNSPWGVVWTPRDFGQFSNSILVGNFGSGKIAAFNGFTGKFIGFVRHENNSALVIHGLWSLTFGNGATAGPATTLFFTAGINDEQDGLFGTLTPVPAEQNGSVE
jgi:uncharacterized protein (TIGR03118 family)